nr:MAG TPA: holin [Caudoviricetes sp.]
MLEFIKANLYDILTVIVFVVGCVFLIRRGYESKVKEMLLYLVCKAEELYGSGTGELKYSAVVTWVYEKLPPIMRLLFTTKQIDCYIEAAVLQMKEYLSKNNQAKSRLTNTISVGAGTTILSEECLKNLTEIQPIKVGE